MTETAETEGQRLKRIRSWLEKRAAICGIIRAFFCHRGFLEVDTPVRSSTIAPELYIDPFQSEGCFLSTSPELYMKRLIAAGYDKIFQLSHCFRKDERGRHHNPEFTLLEWYRMNCDYRQMLNDTEEMVCSIAEALDIGNTISYRNSIIDLTMPWPRITVKDAFLQYAGWDPTVCEDLSTFDIDLVTRVMPSFPSDRPVILADYPASMASLAKISTMNPLVAERAEVFIGGMEIANAYSELADARQQRLRFEHEIKQIQKERNLTYTMPEAFLDALYNFPPSGGIALGIDRLVMLFCNADTIDDVIAFPDA